jgi:transcriptional regulator with XRE-family HTH domain
VFAVVLEGRWFGFTPRNQNVRKYKALLKRLRQAREDAGLKQEDVAQVLGKRRSFVSKCESGERRVDFIELLEFARLYGKNTSYFQVND